MENYNLEQIISIFDEEDNITKTTRRYCELNNIEYSDSLRRRFSTIISQNTEKNQTQRHVEVKNESSANDYKKSSGDFLLSAWDKENGRILSIEQYCEKYNLPFKDISSFKFLPHHYSEPSYNIVFKEKTIDDDIDYDNIKDILEKEFEKVYEYQDCENQELAEGVLKWADLHFGAFIKGLLKTRNFNPDILRQGLLTSVDDFNMLKFKKRHVHIQGDLIESFSGLNHINSWQSMDKDLIGATAIKMCTKLIHDALSKIDNLGCIKITAGNHDRLSKNNDEDVKGGAAELIAWGLELMGYDVEFHPYVITHEVEGINYINLHGDKKVSSKTSEEIVSEYGKHGLYNFITEAHLHSAIEKLTAKQRVKFKTIIDDKLKLRRIVLKPFFTGNYYSETLGYTSNAGYSIFWANEFGLPKMLDNTI